MCSLQERGRNIPGRNSQQEFWGFPKGMCGDSQQECLGIPGGIFWGSQEEFWDSQEECLGFPAGLFEDSHEECVVIPKRNIWGSQQEFWGFPGGVFGDPSRNFLGFPAGISGFPGGIPAGMFGAPLSIPGFPGAQQTACPIRAWGRCCYSWPSLRLPGRVFGSCGFSPGRLFCPWSAQEHVGRGAVSDPGSCSVPGALFLFEWGSR